LESNEVLNRENLIPKNDKQIQSRSQEMQTSASAGELKVEVDIITLYRQVLLLRHNNVKDVHIVIKDGKYVTVNLV
jgi:hypothetical protein